MPGRAASTGPKHTLIMEHAKTLFAIIANCKLCSYVSLEEFHHNFCNLKNLSGVKIFFFHFSRISRICYRYVLRSDISLDLKKSLGSNFKVIVLMVDPAVAGV